MSDSDSESTTSRTKRCAKSMYTDSESDDSTDNVLSDSADEPSTSQHQTNKIDPDLAGFFNPMAELNKNEWHLSNGQSKFVAKYFLEYMGETAIKQSIKKSNPMPNHAALLAPTMDTDILGLLTPVAKIPAASNDGSFRRVQSKLLDVMGPLGKLWQNLDALSTEAKGGKVKTNVKKLLELADQSIVMLGQTNVLINYNRRLNILARFLKDNKAAGELLNANKHVVQKQ